jgi:hypothetical protein
MADQTTTRQQFATQVLTALHMPTTQSNVDFLVGWQQAENTTAANNPLATTWPGVTGATVFNTLTGGGHVWNYPTPQAGIQATADTINGGNYPSIISALQGGNAMQANLSGDLGNNLSTWSGGGYRVVPVPNTSTTPVGTATGGGGYYANSSGGGGTTTAGGGGSAQAAGTGSILGDCTNYRNSSAATTNCLVGGGSAPLVGSWPCVMNACQAKAFVSGFLIFSGGVLMLVGVALLFTGGKGAAGKVAEVAGAGIALIPGAEIAGGAVAAAGHRQSVKSKAFHADKSAQRAQRKAGISSAQGKQSSAQSSAQTSYNRQMGQPRSVPADAGGEDDF